MKFSTTIVALALACAGAEARIQHRRHGASATFTGTAPASTPTQVETSTPSSTPASGSPKRGVSYNDISFVDGFGDKISWAYNWADNAGGSLPSGKEFVPMLWGADSGHTANWANNADAAIKAGATHLLAFNEPDLGAQANLTPEEAAAAWKQFMEPFAGRAKLCSPAITNGGAPMGTAWLDNFLSQCTGCTIDCIAIHIYDSATNNQYFKNYISGVGTKYGKPVWVTEFGASGSSDQQVAFFNDLLPFLDNLESVERYAYFMAAPGILVDNGGNLTPLGVAYNTI